MSIANDLNDVVEASGDMLARLAIFADHIPVSIHQDGVDGISSAGMG